MTIEGLLESRRDDILKGWRALIARSYAAETARFLTTEMDPFSNPVGQAIRESTAAVMRHLCGGNLDREALVRAVDPIVRIRAVQDFEPSQALGFVFQLKDVVRESLRDEGRGGKLEVQIREMDARIDGVALAAFDAFTHCRQQLHEIRIREIKNRSAVILKRMNLFLDDEPVASDGACGNGVVDG